jgi:hypothetical protein
MARRNQSRNLRLKCLAILMLLCCAFQRTQGGLTLFIYREFAVNKMQLDVKNDIFLIRNGVKNEAFRNSKLFTETTNALPATLDHIELTWLALKHDEKYQLRITSENVKILQQPIVKPPDLEGTVTVSKGSRTFAVYLRCTGMVEGLVHIHFSLNYTNFKNITLNRTLDFTISKQCDRSESKTTTESSQTNSIDRTVVVTVSASLALLVCVMIAVVFFWRYVKRIRRRFGFDEATEQLSPCRESFTSSNISIPHISHVPTVVYSPKRHTSGQSFTKIAKHENTTAIQAAHSCESVTTTARENLSNGHVSPISFNGRSSVNNRQLFTQISITDDDVFASNETDVALTQNREKHEERLSLAKDTPDKQLAFATLNEYWTEKLGHSLKCRDEVEIRREVLGEGTFGRVLRGRFVVACQQTENNVDLAVKICQENVEFDHMISLVNEAILMKKLCHENLLELLGVVLQPSSSPLILTPYMHHGDLHKFLRHSRGIGIRRQLIGSQQLVNFGGQIARGMEYLASQKVVHRDLAARNCLVDANLNVKIGDFGLAREVKQFDLYKMEHPTQLAVKWLALESLLYYIFTEKSDVWSFGIVLWELVTLGSQPYAGLDNYEVTQYLETGKRLPRPLRCPDDLYSIMQSCWLPVPEERPLFSVLVHKLEDYELRLRPSCIKFEFDEDTIEMSDGLF